MDFLSLKPLLKNVDDPKKKRNAETIFLDYEENVLPKIPSFEQGIVHCDTNGQNIIVKKSFPGDAYHVAGLIDWPQSENLRCL